MTEMAVDKVTDLFERALCLGYDKAAASRLADCFTNWDMVIEPCPTHPNHSTEHDKNGYTVDMCEACKVIELTDAQGYYPGKWADVLTERADRTVRIIMDSIDVNQRDGECICDLVFEMNDVKRASIPTGGICCLACGSIFTQEGQDASEAVTRVQLTVVGLKAPGALVAQVPAECDNGKCDACRCCLLAIMAGEDTVADVFAQGIAQEYGPRGLATVEPSGMDTLRELLTLEPVPAAPRKRKLPVVHASLVGKAYCHTRGASVRVTDDGSQVTCRKARCQVRAATMRSYAEIKARRNALYMAGMPEHSVVRNRVTGDFGKVNPAEYALGVSYWGHGATTRYDSIEDMVSDVEPVEMSNVIAVGDLIKFTYTKAVAEVGEVYRTWASVGYHTLGSSRFDSLKLSDLCADIAKGYASVVKSV